MWLSSTDFPQNIVLSLNVNKNDNIMINSVYLKKL